MRKAIIVLLFFTFLAPVTSGTYNLLLPLAIAEEKPSQSQLNGQLWSAIRRYREAHVVSKIIDNGADVNIKDSYGRTPLIRAAGSIKNSHNVKLLIEKGADINAKDNLGNTALMVATINGCEASVKMLTDAGATMSSKEKSIVDAKFKEQEAKRLYIEAQKAAAKIQAEMAEKEKAIAAEQAKKAEEIKKGNAK